MGQLTFDQLFERAKTAAKDGGKVLPFPGRKIPVKSIVYTYAEGDPREKAPFLNKIYLDWSSANKAASEMAYYASHYPDGKDMGVDKTDFTVTWKDGEEYKGTLEVRHSARFDGRPLTDHIKGFVMFHAGLKRPAHLTAERYASYLAEVERRHPGNSEQSKAFLQKYDLGDTAPIQKANAPAGKTSRQKDIEAEETKKKAHAAKLAKYPPAVTDRNEAIARIKAALQKRSGKQWSVTGGKGTAWGWIHISAPPKRLVDGYMSKEDQEELKKLLNLDRVSHQYESVAASGGHRTEYVDRAEGREPRTYGQQYWD